jgi:hypothetical protein
VPCLLMSARLTVPTLFMTPSRNVMFLVKNRLEKSHVPFASNPLVRFSTIYFTISCTHDVFLIFSIICLDQVRPMSQLQAAVSIPIIGIAF